MKKDVIAIGAYCPDGEREQILSNLISSIKSNKPELDIVIYSRTHLSQKITSQVNHVIINKMKKFTNTNDDIVAASDAFFPFVDGIEKLVQSGVTAVVQPSGSIRDKEIINFANETDTILVFSKTRHFRH